MQTKIFDEMGQRGHESLYFASDRDTGLRAIIGVHSSTLGPALGGTRIRDYSSVDEALVDVLRLSRGMTYKAAAAGLPLGGGKAVILADPKHDKTDLLLEAYGRAVEALGGTYVTAEDVGSTVADMVVVSRQTAHVTGLPVQMGGSGDPSPATAHGVFAAMQATAKHRWGSPDLAGRRVAVQGVGKVGMALVELLTAAGCKVVVADVDIEAAETACTQHGTDVVPVDEILQTACDILAPCALGGVLNTSTIPRLSCEAIVGCANNQLLEPTDADRLTQAGITYTPDFIANAGGIINIVEELKPAGYSWDKAIIAVRRIYETTARVLERASRQGVTSRAAAVALAEERLTGAASNT